MKKRNTKQKNEILKFLENNKNKHLLIKEIKENIDEKIGTTTVYRVIKELVEEGTIIKKPLENTQGFCYEYKDKNKECLNHYHLICEECNSLTHIESDLVLKACKREEKNLNLKINFEKLVLYGKCKECKN